MIIKRVDGKGTRMVLEPNERNKLLDILMNYQGSQEPFAQDLFIKISKLFEDN